MKFKVDENLPLEFAELLIAAGYDAVTVVAEGLQGRDDATITTYVYERSASWLLWI